MCCVRTVVAGCVAHEPGGALRGQSHTESPHENVGDSCLRLTGHISIVSKPGKSSSPSKSHPELSKSGKSCYL